MITLLVGADENKVGGRSGGGSGVV